MKTVMQKGYEGEYTSYFDRQVHAFRIERVTKYKIVKTQNNPGWFDMIFFFKGKEVYRISASQLYFINRIYTPCLEEHNWWVRTWCIIKSTINSLWKINQNTKNK